MNGLTRFFLVLLRLAIGWHFLFEGIEKIQSVQTGPTETNRPWTSEAYLREAAGPLVGYFRSQFGDPDEAALARLTVQPLPPGQDPSRVPAHTRMPPELARDWDTYFERFVRHYPLNDEQRELAKIKLDQAKEQAVHWLLEGGAQAVKRSFPTGTVERKETPPERLAYYRTKLAELRDLESRELPTFERDVAKQRLRPLKAEVAKLRTDLITDLNKPMRESLASILTPEQKQMALPDTPHWWQWSVRDWTQWLICWGLIVTGACLLLSFLGQLAASHSRSLRQLGNLEWTLVALLAVLGAAGLSGFLAWIVRFVADASWATRGEWLRNWSLAVLGGCLLFSLIVQSVCRAKGCAQWSWGRWLLAWGLALLGAGLAVGLASYVALSWSDWTQQELLDWLVTFGLTAAGLCLLVGFLTRPACLVGALLLLMFYLAMPPVPGVPDNPRAEGHYLFINKNLIEMLALLALATTHSGRWLGLDGLLPVLNPVRWFVRPRGDAADSQAFNTPRRRVFTHGN
jgi:uncharacterized membrane protein YphA (DoxX/SURF4 family)